MKHIIVLIIVLPIIITSCQKEDFTSSGFANDIFYLQSDGQNMPVSVIGNLDSDKFLLIVHGGPGGNSIVYRDSHVIKNVEKEFAVVYWDQRFAGGTQGNTGSTHISAFRSDMKKLIMLLKSKYGQHKEVYLFAHSWGGFLAPYFLIQEGNQELVDGWIQIGGAHNYLLNDSLTQQMLIFYGEQEISAERNTEDWEPIVEFCLTNTYIGRSNAVKLNQYAHSAERLIPDVVYPEVTIASMISGMFTTSTPIISHFANGLAAGIYRVDDPTYKEPISENLHKINIPALMLWGKYDFVCPPELMDDILDNVGSNDIETFVFLFSGHSPMMNQPDLFWETVINWINSK